MEFDKDKYTIWKLPNLLLIHWIINPAIAFNEIILGQRLPKLTLIDKTSDAPLLERQYIPCPHCESMNDARLWAKSNAFGHWFGYVCPKCDGIIPCLWNFTSLVILALTFPIWMPIKHFGKAKWLKYEKQRLLHAEQQPKVKAEPKLWIKAGVLFGFLMFLFTLLMKGSTGELNPQNIPYYALVNFVGGAAFGLIMKIVLGWKKKS
ncbi:hypothetical protein [Parashewanella tropica]|uniref:hypothetical protein n=1 Tax=Parashewanella tropica TaxID=2547970 RepID=UPI00105A3B22|nr:hypothetical protein [Parashewanella tropica]